MSLDLQSIQELDSRHHASLYKRLNLCIVRGKGARVWDSDGNEYLDCVAGIAVNNVGHCHPRVVEAIRKQAGELIHCSNLYYIKPQAALAAKLAGMLPEGLDRLFFCNSGTEAIEAALKLIRRTSGKPGIIAAEGSFHGRTFGALSVTGQEKYRVPFEPVVPGVRFVKFGDLDALSDAMDETVGGIILEPIQGEGGVVASTREYLAGATRLCQESGAVLAFDEVQTGMGRTGKFLACQSYGVTPDIVSMAKGLGGGFPIGAMAAREEVMSKFQAGDHASTFGGNPLACAAAHAALEVLQEENLLERSAELGEWALGRMVEIRSRHPSEIIQARGLGLMLGLEMASEEVAKQVFEECLRQRVLVNRTAGTVIRLVPPLIITKDELSTALSVIEEALAA